jgi:hypothetical protein
MNETSTDTTNEQDYAEQYEATRSAAIQALTDAARLRHPKYGQLDFAEFAAHVLAAVAGNVGGADRLLAGRPGSWEADKVGDVLYSTAGYDDAAFDRYRTEPVIIHLNVHRLMLIHGPRNDEGATPYELELYAVGDRYALLSDEEYDEAAAEAENAECEAITAAWATRYADFAAAFAAAVQAEAARVDGVTVPVRVEAEATPDGGDDSTPEHPEDIAYDDPAFDPLALRLWTAALAAVSLPTSDPTHGDRP